MKQNRFTTLLAAGAVCAFAATAVAQTSSTTVTTSPSSTDVSASTTTTGTGVASSSSTTTTTTTSPGVITAFTPGSEFITFRTETSKEPVKYYYSKTTTVVDPTGATVAIDQLRPDMPATVYYAKEGDRMVVSKIVLTKPIATYEKKETTTTTTTTEK